METIKTVKHQDLFQKDRGRHTQGQGDNIWNHGKRPILTDLKRTIIKRVRHVIDKIRDIERFLIYKNPVLS